ncbi:MAG: glycosyltransferase family 9 protein [Vulcanimicrobiaceae bacterium]
MKRTLAVRQDNNGDVTLTGPAIRALACDADVTLLAAPSGEGAARLLPGVADVIVARAEWIDANPQPVDPVRTNELIARLAAFRFDEAFIFTSFHQSPLPAALLLRLAGVRFVAAISVDYPGSLLDVRASVPDDVHEVERNLALVRACDRALPAGDDGALRFAALPSASMAGAEPYVVVQPGATVAARTWRPARWRELLEAMERLGHRTVVVGSPSERELTRDLCRNLSAIDLGGRTSFPEYAAVVANARALVCGNTAGIHVAGAVGTPVVALFPPTIPLVRFAPFRVPHAVLGVQDVPCAGCRARTCPLPDQICLETVATDDVVAALEGLGSSTSFAA